MKILSDSLLEVVGRTNNIVLATHINPDGDALGSLIGLADVLDAMGKKVFRYLEEPVSDQYRFLPDTALLQTGMESLREFVRRAGDDILCISLDCGDRKRLGKNGGELENIKPLAVIDHHKNNSGFGEFAWIDPDRSSTGEMVFDLAAALGQPLSLNAATALFAAIMSDTGSFRYESTSVHTFNVAARLVGLGVKPDEVSRRLFDNFSVGRLQLLQQVLATMEFHGGGRIAVIRVTTEMLEKTGCSMVDTENFINQPRSVTTVKAAVFLKQAGPDLVSVSLRAKGGCDVAEAAARFGGGGHRNAAGFKMTGVTLDEVRDRLVQVLLEEFAC